MMARATLTMWLRRGYAPAVSEIPRIAAVTAATRPRWSVVIPVHNCAGYSGTGTARGARSAGDRPDAEILVVDDASSDDPAAVVERLGRGRVIVPTQSGPPGRHRHVQPVPGSRSGELVHLLHGDDAVLPGFYAAMERALADPASVAASAGSRTSMPAAGRLYTTRSYRDGTGVWTDALESLAVSNRVRAPAIVVRRAAYERGRRLPHRPAARRRLGDVDPARCSRSHRLRRRGARGYRRHDTSDTSTRSGPAPTSGSGSPPSVWLRVTSHRTDRLQRRARHSPTQRPSPPARRCRWQRRTTGPPRADKPARRPIAWGCSRVVFR